MSLWSSSSNWFSIRKYQGWYIIDPACASRGHHTIDSSLKIIRFDIHPACDFRVHYSTNSLLNIIKFDLDPDVPPEPIISLILHQNVIKFDILPACASRADYLIDS